MICESQQPGPNTRAVFVHRAGRRRVKRFFPATASLDDIFASLVLENGHASGLRIEATKQHFSEKKNV